MTRIKICGIQEPADAITALRAGADLLGLVFVPGRRRKVDIQRAREVVSAVQKESDSPPPVVGLFADQDLDEVNQTVRLGGLDMAQLCGQESAQYCGQVEVPVIKVVHVRPEWGSEEAVQALDQQISTLTAAGHWVTLDRKVEGLQGGTGEAFDWRIAGGLSARGHSFMLAGGLSPENVEEAMRTARPWGVDVSSGVETNGRKDSAKVRSFIARVRAASQ